MKNKTFKQFIIIIILFIWTIGVYNLPKIFIKKNEELPEVKLKDIKSSKSFAIMVQNGDDYEEYTSEDNNWPGADYVFKEAKCINNNGALVTDAIIFEDGKATLTTNQTIYCTLYFDEKPIIEILRKKDTKKYLSEDLQGGMYRYQAAPAGETEAALMTNWICFGTTDNCGANNNLIDKYMYRIIGITKKGELYLLKETFLKEGDVTGFTWNDKFTVSGEYAYTCDGKKCPEWNTSLLLKRLNGTSNGTTQGTGSYSNNADTDIFVDSNEYDYLKSGDSNSGGEASEWYNLIADHEWMYGDTVISSIAADIYNGDKMYAIETGNSETIHYVGTDGSNTEQTYNWNQKVKAKISLMYIHDYVYSYYDGLTEESRGNPKNYSAAKNSWIHFQKDGYQTDQSYEWLSTRWGVYSLSDTSVYALRVSNYGDMAGRTLANALGVRPVFYLSSKVKIASGEGTKNDPFILSLN